MAYTKTPSSGMTNIQITPENTFCVIVKGQYLGKFKLREKSKRVRDDFRAKNNMTKIED